MNSVEVWQAIRAVLVADATFTAYLASAESVMESHPGAPLVDGCVTIRVMSDNPDVDLSGLGRWNPQLQINFYHSNPSTLELMKVRADALLEIPRSRTNPIDSDNYRISQLVRPGSNDLGPVVKLTDGKQLRQTATTWKAVVTKLA
jgi:hypothetical protein